MKRLLIGMMCLFSVFTNTWMEASANNMIQTEESNEKMYGIGSVSKVFTAAAVMKLVEDGKIDLDEPIITYLPDFTMTDERYKKITPRMLLNHSSGLMGMTAHNAMLYDDNDTELHDHFLELLSSQTLKHEPGDRSIYSNDSFTLAEILVEHVSGMSFTEYLNVTFFNPLHLSHIKTPVDEFDRSWLADTYLGTRPLTSENLMVIGSGGIYASMSDLLRFSSIFMDQADGAILSKESTTEMAKNQHQMELPASDSDTTFRYGLGWDAVDTFPFNLYGIQALSKGGTSLSFHTNLTVLPKYNMAAAVSITGSASEANPQLIAQEILLEVLREEGLIPKESELSLPVQNSERAIVPDEIKTYAGMYQAGSMGYLSVEFTNDSLILTPIGVRNERPQEYNYNTDGYFISANGDVFTNTSSSSDIYSVSSLSFRDNKYIVEQSYTDYPGLSITASAMPIAEKVEPNSVSETALQAWDSRKDQEYLLVSEKYTSSNYILHPVAKIHTDSRISGYVLNGLYQAGEGGRKNVLSAKILNENTALGYQSIPTMLGRDINNLYAYTQNSINYLNVNEYRFIEASAAKLYSSIENNIVIQEETVWIQIDDLSKGQRLHIQTPQGGSWFVYDENMNCIASSLEENPPENIILPENGKIALAGEEGVAFVLNQ